MRVSKCEPEVNKNVSHCANEGGPFSEIRKSLDILEDVFSELPDKDDSPGRQDPNHAGSDASKGSMPFTANELLQLLSKGGITTKDQPETASDQSGCKSTSDALLQLVHTDHPYLCKTQDADDTEEAPVKSGSCSSIPDPEIIHDFFLHTTNMISYQPIGGALELGGVPVPSPTPTLIGSPHLTCKTIPDPKCASSENSAGCGNRGEDKERPKEKSELKFTSLEESEKPEVGLSSVKAGHQKLVQTSVADSDKSKELKQKECSDKNRREGDSELNNSLTNEESKDIKKNLKASNPKDVTETGQSNNDEETKHVNYKTLQADESSVFSNMVKPSSLNQIDQNSWTAACKAMADKVQEESLIHCAVSLLLKVWTDYLSLTFEEVRAREIQVAQENNYTDDVIAMIEDRDRYVWQLIEEMEPRNFVIDL